MSIIPEIIKKDFDEALVKNLERNVETSTELSGISFNMATVTSLVLLVEKEGELEVDPSDAPERFTQETFFNELEDFGLDANENVQQEVQAMIENGYIVVEPDGSFLAQEPAMDAVGLLDKAFPGLPGMNLVAYLAQTLEEALSGRKDPKFAIAQLEQTLEKYGGSAQKQTSTAKPSTSKKPTQQSAEALKSALSASLRKRQAQTRAHKRDDSEGQPKIVTASGAVKNIQVQAVFAKHHDTTEAPGESLEEKGLQEPLPAGEDAASTADKDLASETVARVTDDNDPIDSQGSSGETLEVAPESGPDTGEKDDTHLEDTEAAQAVSLEHQTTSLPETAALSSESPPAGEVLEGHAEAHATEADEKTTDIQEDMASMSEEALAERIAAFEQDLAMTCPACGDGKIETKETAKGKVFYVCNRQECVFVSWGKPYHLECPWCKNPFLIEATGKGDKKMLKCPRATCKYKQGMPGDTAPPQSIKKTASAQSPTSSLGKTKKPRKKKRVVRRRVVRRKR